MFYSWIPLPPEVSRLSPYAHVRQHTRTSRTFYTFAVPRPGLINPFNTTHREEQKKRIEAIKADEFEDPAVHLLHVTRKAACAQAEKAVDAFLSSIKSTLHKHIPTHAQGPLIANALSTAFQFQMSVWHMIGEECVRPVRARHLDWCDLASIIQAIVEMFPKNSALMFPPPPAPMPPKSFSSTFRPASSNEDDDDDDNTVGTKSFCCFGTSSPAPSV